MVNLADSDDNTVSKYEELLINDIDDQKLSISSSIGPSQKKAIINGLVNNDFELSDKSIRTTADEFTFMRKEALILAKDLRDGKDSLIVKHFKEIATPQQIETIKANATKIDPNKSIDISPDQFKNLHDFVASGEQYPSLLPDSTVDYNSVVDFLEKLSNVFKWRIYEKKTLGYVNQDDLALSHITWYANILYKWMSGDGLNYIIYNAIDYKERHPETGIWANNWKIEERYDKNDPKHKNLVIADTLNTIENVVLFSIANYFREFSAEYKKQHGNVPFNNDWYEYVEYGTTSPMTILLQRYGYNREAATYIIRHKDTLIDFTVKTNTAPFALRKKLLLECSDESTRTETLEICINIPELFIK